MSEQAPQTGFKAHVAAEQALQAQIGDSQSAEALNAQTAANLAIDARRNSAEVSELNGAAEIALFGSGGRNAVITESANSLTPGKEHRHPVNGRVNDILQSPRYTVDKAQVTADLRERIGNDLYKVDSAGRPRRPSEDSKMMSQDQADLVEAHKDQIVDHLMTDVKISRAVAKAEKKSGKEAQAASDKKKNEALALVDEGFELAQAKLIIDQRELWAGSNERNGREQTKENNVFARDVQRRLDLITAQNIKNGDSPEDAATKATLRVAGHSSPNLPSEPGEAATKKIDIDAEDAKLRALIKSKGIFTREELDAATNNDGGDGEDPTQDPTQVLRTREQSPAERRLELLSAETAEARQLYAYRSAGRARRHFRFGSQFNKAAIAQAKRTYDIARRHQTEHEHEMALDAGVSQEDLNNYAPFDAIGDAANLAQAVYTERLLATGRHEYQRTDDGLGYELDDNGNRILSRVEPKTVIGRTANSFYDWWGQQANARFFSRATLKKTAVMAGAGVVVGVPAAITGSILIGPIAGGAVGALAASKIAKGVMIHHVGTRANGENRAEELFYDVRDAAYAAGNPNIHPDQLDGVAYHLDNGLDNETGAELHRNRVRAAASIGAAALGGLVGEAVTKFAADGVHNLLDGGSDSTVSGGGNTHPSGGGSHPGGGGHNSQPQGSGGNGNQPNGNGNHNGNGGNQSQNPDVQPNQDPSSGSIRLNAGDNPWTASQQQLELHGIQNPSAAQIELFDKAMANLNPYDYFGPSSENLAVGTELQLPSLSVFEQISNTK